MRVVEGEAARPREVSPAEDRDLEAVCLKCLEKEPSRRYASAEELAGDLRRWLAGEPVRARRGWCCRGLRRWRRAARRAAFGVVLLLAVIGLGVVRLMSSREAAVAGRAEAEARQRAEEEGKRKATPAPEDRSKKEPKGPPEEARKESPGP